MTDEDVLDPQENQGRDSEPDVDQEPQAEKAEPSLQEKLKAAVDVAVEDVGPLRKKLSITVPREAIDGQLDEQYEELRREALVPGFRKGRAPRRLLEKRFGSEVGETLVQRFVTTGYVAATEKVDLKVLGDPMIWATEKGADTQTLMDVSKALDLLEVPKEGPFVFSCEVEVRPEFALPELDGIAITRPVITVTDEQVDGQMKRLQGMLGTYTTVSDGAAQTDDIVVADLKMTCGEAVLKEEQNVRLAARPQVVDGVVLETLGEVLAGARVGDLRKTTGQIPETYIKQEFRGQPADLAITVRQIQRLELPAVNEEFCKHFGFDSPAQLRDWVRLDLQSRLGEQVKEHMADQVCQYLLDKTSFDLPERLSERQISHVTVRRMIELYERGVPPAEVEKILDELKTRARQDAVRSLKLAFIFARLAEQFGDEVEVTEEEVNAQIAGMARRQGRRFDRVRDELARRGALDDLYLRIRDDKIVACLLAKAAVTDEKPPPPAADKQTEAPAAGPKKPRKAKAKAAGDEAAPPADGGQTAPPAQSRRRPPSRSKDKPSEPPTDAT